jgi:lipopolysaccharide transport system permease protein
VLSQAIAAGLLITVELFSTGKLSWHMIFLLPVLVSQMLFTAGVCWLLASLGVYIRDLKHVMALALSAWMFATPIVYPASKFPANLQFLLWINPLAGIVSDYRRIIIERQYPDWHFFLAYTSIGIVFCLIGFAFFYKTKRSFADIM